MDEKLRHPGLEVGPVTAVLPCAASSTSGRDASIFVTADTVVSRWVAAAE
jgi:hypothetical protein